MKDESISISKALAIFLMVIAHARCPLWGQYYINMFHMPLFFFFSGYCFKESYLGDFYLYAKKRVVGVYWPFVKWGLLFLLLHNIFYYLNIYNGEYGFRDTVSHLYSSKEYLQNALLLVGGMRHTEQLLGGYWFLKSLFYASFIFYATIRLLKNGLIGGGILMLFCVLMLYCNINLPVITAREFLAASFMMIGYEYKKRNYTLENKRNTIVVGFLLTVIGTIYWQCGMLQLVWQKVFPYFVSAIAGTLMVFSISKIIVEKKELKTLKQLLCFVGNNTLTVLTWHLLCFKIISYFIILFYDIPSSRLAEFPVIEEYAYKGWWLLYCIIGVAIPLSIKYIITKKRVLGVS